jgi:hypothetical protein
MGNFFSKAGDISPDAKLGYNPHRDGPPTLLPGEDKYGFLGSSKPIYHFGDGGGYSMGGGGCDGGAGSGN